MSAEAPTELKARWLSNADLTFLIRQSDGEKVLQCRINGGGHLLQAIEGNRWAFDALDAKKAIDEDWRAAMAKFKP